MDSKRGVWVYFRRCLPDLSKERAACRLRGRIGTRQF